MSTSASSETGAAPYDETPYPSAAFPQTHPNRLAAMGRIFGVAAAAPSGARVLELGCSDGSNLLPMAEQAPGATFLGLDNSKVAMAAGQQALAAAGLKNVELRLQNILDFPTTEGKFDYIIVHGVYSWVPVVVREKILSICQEHLTENGIAYISYNAHPGWNMRRSLREMMLFHTRNLTEPKKKVQQARALLAFLVESVPAENSAYGILLKNELSLMSGMADNYLLHDILGAENTPFYFHEFVSQAAEHELQYLGETSVAEMLAANFPEKVSQTLAQLNSQIVAQEQYMDFLRNRSFRQTLLCRASVGIQRAIAPANLAQMAFRSLLVRATGAVELIPGVPMSFVTATGTQITSTDSFVKALLLTLTETKSVSAISYSAILENARARSRSFQGEIPSNRNQIEEATLQSNLMSLLAKAFVEIYAEPVSTRTDIPERPSVGSVVRYQAMGTRLLTNRLHQSAPADIVARYIVAACDGTRSHDELLSELVARVNEGKLQVNEGSEKVTDEQKLKTLLRPGLDSALAALATAGFFAP